MELAIVSAESTTVIVTKDGETGNEIGKDVSSLEEEHTRVLTNTRHLGMKLLLIMGITVYCDTNTDQVWGLYAHNEFGANNAEIGLLFSVYFLMSGLGLFVLAWVAERVGFARMLTIDLIIAAPMLLLQGFATTIPQLTAGRMLAAFFTPDSSIIFGYICRYLPIAYHQPYDGYMNATTMFVGVLGSLTSGILAQIVGLRSCFYVVGALAVVTFFVGIFTIFNEQAVIDKQQREYCWKSKEVVIAHQKGTAAAGEDESVIFDKHLFFPMMTNVLKEDEDDAMQSEKKLAPPTPCWQWTMIVLMACYAFTSWGAMFLIYAFYALYVEIKFGVDVIIPTMQLGLFNIGIMAGALLGPKFVIAKIAAYIKTRYPPKESETAMIKRDSAVAEYICMIVPLALSPLILACCPLVDSTHPMWVVLPLNAVFFGVQSVAELAILQMIQPLQHTTAIGGVFQAFIFVGGAVSSFVVGHFWEATHDHEWFWYWMFILRIAALVFGCAVAAINYCKMGALVRVNAGGSEEAH